MQWVAEVGAATGRSVAYVGGLAEIFGKSLRLLFLSPLKRDRLLQRAVHEAMAVGVGAVPIISLITFFVGVIIALQGAYELQRLGAMQLVPPLVAISITRELGPLVTAIVVIGRSGSAFAAEIGTMRVTEELDALNTMALDPVAFLVVPKFLAMAVMMPCLAIWADLMGVLGGSLFGVIGGGFTFGGYLIATRDALLMRDVTSGFIKSLVFGMVITAVGCQRGLLDRRRRGRGRPLHHFGRRDLHSAGDPDRSALHRAVLRGARGAHRRWLRPPIPIISASDLRVRYGDREVLHGLTFEVRRGETMVVIGGSGSGKSTLLRTLVGLEKPSVRTGAGSRAWTSPGPAPARWTPSANASAWPSRAAP